MTDNTIDSATHASPAAPQWLALGTVAGPILFTLAWFVLGYALFACMFAVAGALVPRQEDIQNTTTPLSIVLFGSVMLSFAAIDDPGGEPVAVADELEVEQQHGDEGNRLHVA